MNESNNESMGSTMETGAKSPISVTKLKEYGMKAYRPLVDVVFKYQDEFTPYLTALAKGLQGGKESLSREGSSEAEQYVAQFFQQAADGLNQACEKLESKDINSITTFLTEQAEQRPSVMFSTSYIAGIFFGRLGRHIARKSTIH
ncbi:MAG: hypothetical protein ACJ749_01595 [Flavisolibacter sp.]